MKPHNAVPSTSKDSPDQAFTNPDIVTIHYICLYWLKCCNSSQSLMMTMKLKQHFWC